ncbi:hypothetical protein ACWIGI_03180 [Nocardia sp. NPDC055321]
MTSTLYGPASPPSWVGQRSAAWNLLTADGIAQSSPADGATTGGRVHNVSVRDGVAAALEYARTRNVQELLSGSAGNQVKPIADPLDALIDPSNSTGDIGPVPTLAELATPGLSEQPKPQPVPEPQKPSVERPVQSQSNPAANRNPLYEPPISVPGAKAEPEASVPPTSLLDMPNLEGHGVGDSWNGMLDKRPVRYTIPEGNGTNSVDLEITNPDGTVDRWRIARDEAGGLQHWHDDANGQSSYAVQVTAGSNWEIQSFAPGVSTSGAPSSVLQADPDLRTIQTPSFIDGVQVGTDVGKLNAFGLYDNYHVDNFGNLTITHARPDGFGGVDSKFYQQWDRNSWRLGEDGQFWEVGPDLQGRITKGRTVETPTGTHIYFIDHNNVLFDSFRGIRTPLGTSPAYTDRYIDTKLLRKYSDGTAVVFDSDFNIVSLSGVPDRRDGIQRAIDGIGAAPGSIKQAVMSWFSRTSGMDALANSAANIGNPYYNPPTTLERIATFSEGIADPVKFAGSIVLHPYLTVSEWAGRHILAGGLYGSSYFASGDTKQDLAGTADDILDASPGAMDAAISAGVVLLPMAGSIFGGIGSGAASLSKLLKSVTPAIKLQGNLYPRQRQIKNALEASVPFRKIAGPAASRIRQDVGIGMEGLAGGLASARMWVSDSTTRMANTLTSASIVIRSLGNQIRLPGLVPIGPDLTRWRRFNVAMARLPAGPLRPPTLSQVNNGLPAWRLPPYINPSELSGPEIALSSKAFGLLKNPYITQGARKGQLRNLNLEPRTKYVHTDSHGRRTIIVTDQNGMPTYVQAWASELRVPGTEIVDLNPLLHHPLPNVVYRVEKKSAEGIDEFMLRMDEYGRVVEGYNSRLKIATDVLRTRVSGQQNTFNKGQTNLPRGPVDAGHVFGAEFGSPAERIFYTHQMRSVNQSPGQMYMIERAISRFLKKPGNPSRVEYHASIEYSHRPAAVGWRAVDAERLPSAYYIRYRVPGTIQWIRNAFIPNF